MNCTKRIRDGLTEMCAIVETILEAGGEGWALECRAGEDFGPCNQCDVCRSFRNARDACHWLRVFIAQREKGVPS